MGTLWVGFLPQANSLFVLKEVEIEKGGQAIVEASPEQNAAGRFSDGTPS